MCLCSGDAQICPYSIGSRFDPQTRSGTLTVRRLMQLNTSRKGCSAQVGHPVFWITPSISLPAPLSSDVMSNAECCINRGVFILASADISQVTVIYGHSVALPER
jgi:hypothetical protein